MKVIHHANLILERNLVTFQAHGKLNNLLEYQGRTELANPKNNITKVGESGRYNFIIQHTNVRPFPAGIIIGTIEVLSEH